MIKKKGRYRGRNLKSREQSRCSVDERAARIRDEPGACARAHPWDLESSGLCRERAEELGRLAREVGESVPEAPPPRTPSPPYFFARGRRSASGAHFCPLPSLRALAAAPELPEATETDGRRCVYY